MSMDDMDRALELVREHGDEADIVDADFESSGIPDAIWFTLTERRDSDLPEGLVLVMQDLDGFYACLDTRGIAQGGEAPVVAWFEGEPSERLADDFGAYMREQLEQALQD